MCFSSWKMAFQLHEIAISPFIGVFSSFQSPVSFLSKFSLHGIVTQSTGCAWTFRKSKCWKALIAPGKRSPLNLFSLLVTFLIKGLTNDIQEG